MAKQKKKKKHRLFWFLAQLQFVLMILVLGGFLYYNYGGYAKLVQEYQQEAITLVRGSTEETFVPSQTSEVYDASGELISYYKGAKTSDYVEYDDIPKDFVSAMISIEDKRFYQHKGIDLIAIVRSAKAIVESGSITQGGSTITMQLARNVYLDSGKRLERKLKEMFIAAELEKRYSKNKIMEYYLNNIYFANGYYGIQAACTGYFSCELDELSLSQIAFLCAIPNSPSYYDPVTNYDNTIARRNRILKQMYEDGKIDEVTYNSALDEKIVLQPSSSNKSQMYNYVDTYVYYCATRALMENRGFVFQEEFATAEEEKLYYEEYDELYAECQKEIYSKGYKIYTSIELDKQELLQKSVDEGLAGFTDVGEDGVFKMQGAAVSIDNETGYVVAIVGGRGQDLGYYTLNRAYQSFRQPGSSIKPLIVYTPFFELGNNPDTLVLDAYIENGPQSGYYYGPVTVRFAVELSLNSPAWSVYSQITPKVGLSYLKNMNFSALEKSDEVPATAIGGFTKGTSPLEMAAAYATIENDGVYRTPTCIVKIVDAEENTVYESKQEGVKIYKETAARMMTDVLSTTIDIATDGVAKLESTASAGKTGTTNSNKDGWFVGYTRYYTTAVWVGCDMPEPVADLSGKTYPTTIWANYMKPIHEGVTPLNFLPYAQLSDDFWEQYYPQDSETETEESQTEESVDNPEEQPEHELPEEVETPQEPENAEQVAP